MNILAIPTTFGFSKPISGGQSRFSNLIIELKNRGHNIILLESDNVVDLKDEQIEKVYCYKDLSIFNRTLSIFKDLNINFISTFLRLLHENEIDLIQVTHPSGVLVIKTLCKIKGKNIPLIYDAHNVESDFVKEVIYNSTKYSKFEQSIIYNYTFWLEKVVTKYAVTYITVVSEKDKKTFVKKHGINPIKISVIPSGCRFSKFEYDLSDQGNIRNKLDIPLDKTSIIFHGSYAHPPNRKAFENVIYHIAPLFEKKYPNVLFLIGGSECPKFNRKNVKSLGFIDDLYGVISTADIAIVPLDNGAGTKLKIFDYFCVGVPVITTEKGIEGIDARNGENAVIVENVGPDFINAIKYLVENKSERKRIGLNGFQLAREKYDWVKIGDNLGKLYLKILKNRAFRSELATN